MKQRVKQVSYLAKVVLDLKDLGTNTKEVVALPAGAEITHISVETLEAGAGALSLGLGAEKEAIATNVDVTKVGSQSVAFVGMTKDITKLTLTPTIAGNAGRVVIRVVYFLPSELVVEY